MKKRLLATLTCICILTFSFSSYANDEFDSINPDELTKEELSDSFIDLRDTYNILFDLYSQELMNNGTNVAGSTINDIQQLSDEELENLINDAQKELDNRKKSISVESSGDFGNWIVKYFVDEFNLPTDQAYITYNTLFTGTFSNSATSDSLLHARLLIDEYVAIMLYEYGDQQVTAYSSADYNIIMLDKNGNKTQIVGVMHDNGDRVIITRDYTQTVLDALIAGGEISFYLAEKDHSITNYLFTIPDATGFDNAYNSIAF